jgi:hypothetical protein
MRQRAVIATTHIDRHSMIVTKDTLEAFAEQINGGSRPLITVEHDVTLPPYGKTVKAWVQPRDDGEFELVVENEIFDQVLWAELTDGTRLFKQESETDRYPFADRYEDQTGDVFLSYDRINFDSEENIKSFIEDIRNHSKLEFSANEFGRKSYILDPEFLIRIAKAVGTYLIAKNVLNKTGDKVLELASEDIAKSYIFLKSVISSAVKYARPKNRPITYVFVIRDKPAVEFIARSTNADLVISAVAPEKLDAVLAETNFIYSAFEAAKVQYLLNTEGKWKFNYLQTNTGAVIGTEESLSRRTERFKLLRQRQAMDEAKAEQNNIP